VKTPQVHVWLHVRAWKNTLKKTFPVDKEGIRFAYVPPLEKLFQDFIGWTSRRMLEKLVSLTKEEENNGWEVPSTLTCNQTRRKQFVY